MSAGKLGSLFDHFASRAAGWSGHPLAFALAVALLVAWAISGPAFGYSETWQLVVNTGTTIVTFLMVFVIQNSQNRDARAHQIKLDELIRALGGAKNDMIGLEELTTRELDDLHEKFSTIARSARNQTAAVRRERTRRTSPGRTRKNKTVEPA